MAPSTLGKLLRRFSFGHVRELDRVCEVYGHQKQGASYGYTKVLGYHPLFATRADTSETLQVRFRKGSANTQRGAQRFVREVVGRVRRAGASGALTLRCVPGFFSKYVVETCRDHQVRYSITARQTPAFKELSSRSARTPGPGSTTR